MTTQTIECPSDAELISFLDQDAGTTYAAIGEHLEFCENCQQRLDRTLAKAGSPITITEDEVERAQCAQLKAMDFIGKPQDDVLPADHPWNEIKHIDLLKCIGRGGMGAVFEAVQKHPIERRVAVKFVRSDLWGSELIERFKRETQLLATSEHPYIARLYDAGQLPAGDPYLVMEFVDGTAITKFCNERSLGVKERLELFIDVCNAVQYLHYRQIIHRDLKPANVLVVDGPERGVPKLIDFGLARELHLRPGNREYETGVAQPIGTLRYMSPEQACQSGKTKTLVDSRTDIYSLGVLLFELLTGDTPVSAEQARSSSFLEVLLQIQNETPSRLSQRMKAASTTESLAPPGISPKKVLQEATRELDWIIVRALQKDPTDRYASATSLAHDISNYLSNHPITARPPSLFYQVTKFCQRHVGIVAAAALLLITLLLGTLGTTIGFFQARQAAQNASMLADREKEMREVAEARLSNLNHAARILHGVFEQINPEIASSGTAGDLRAELREGLERAASEMLEVDAAEGSDTLVLKISLAKALQNLERTDAALPLIKQVLEHAQASSISVEDRIALWATLGDAYRRGKRLEEAYAAFAQVDDLAQSNFEDEHRLVLAGKYYLSIVAGDLGDFKEAQAAAQAVADKSSIEDPESANMHILALGQVAYASAQSEDFETAVRNYERVLEYWQSQLPEIHPMVLEAQSNLALCIAKSGEKPRAKEMLSDVLEKTLAQYPEDSQRVKQAQQNLRSLDSSPSTNSGTGLIEE